MEEVLAALDAATERLLSDLDGLTDDDAQEPSLLPGWSRGHVLAHLARNAEGGTRLLGWALTGVPSHEYRSVTARAEAIEEGAHRPALTLVADVRRTAGTFADRARLLPADAWRHIVVWTTGDHTAADEILRSRLAEVLIHHTDLDLGPASSGWPPAWTRDMLDAVVAGLEEKGAAGFTAILEASDSGARRELRMGGRDLGTLRATEAVLLAWLMGRNDGSQITLEAGGPLPAVPSSYKV